jgi:hypothetical protein
MTERFISDSFWNDPMIESCDTEGKCLYIYLFTNPHQKSHGIFTATIRTISFETGIEPAKIEELIDYFGEDKVKWVRSKSQFWVKNFIIRQAKNASFLQSAINHLFLDIKDAELLKEYLEYYGTMGLWSKYGDNTVSTPSNTVLYCNNTNTVLSSTEKGDIQGGRGDNGRKRFIKPSEDPAEWERRYGHMLKGKGGA